MWRIKMMRASNVPSEDSDTSISCSSSKVLRRYPFWFPSMNLNISLYNWRSWNWKQAPKLNCGMTYGFNLKRCCISSFLLIRAVSLPTYFCFARNLAKWTKLNIVEVLDSIPEHFSLENHLSCKEKKDIGAIVSHVELEIQVEMLIGRV